MTALSKYQRLEASALWRDSISGQRRDVIVSLGDASLVITDKNERPLTHWSLAAVQRANPGAMPAVFHPDGDPDETLELGESETEMVEAIEKLRQVIERRRPKPGRLRIISFLTILTLFAALMVFWMPGAVRDYTLRVLPDVTEQDIGNGLLQELERFTGRACTSSLSINCQIALVSSRSCQIACLTGHPRVIYVSRPCDVPARRVICPKRSRPAWERNCGQPYVGGGL